MSHDILLSHSYGSAQSMEEVWTHPLSIKPVNGTFARYRTSDNFPTENGDGEMGINLGTRTHFLDLELESLSAKFGYDTCEDGSQNSVEACRSFHRNGSFFPTQSSILAD
jgi:hypothetical protein